ncbi:MAG: GNAT family N-acetyltransferase [Acidobacteriota bacterium]
MADPSNITIRPLTPEDQSFLWEMLYEALYVPEGGEPFPRSIVNLPEISRYAEGWGKSDDTGLVAVDENDQPIGAAWIRLMTSGNRGYGYVDDTTPELSIAVAPRYRGRGVGTKLLVRLFEQTENRYRAISLSVSSDNPAVRLYLRLGFEVVTKNGDSLTMVRRMRGD